MTEDDVRHVGPLRHPTIPGAATPTLSGLRPVTDVTLSLGVEDEARILCRSFHRQWQ